MRHPRKLVLAGCLTALIVSIFEILLHVVLWYPFLICLIYSLWIGPKLIDLVTNLGDDSSISLSGLGCTKSGKSLQLLVELWLPCTTFYYVKKTKTQTNLFYCIFAFICYKVGNIL